MPGRDRIAEEEGADGGDPDRDRSRRVAWQTDDLRRTGQIEHVTVVHRAHLAEMLRAHRPAAHRDAEEPQRRTELPGAAGRRRRLRTASTAGVRLVHERRYAVLAAQPLRHPDVIAVAVREHDAADVVDRASGRGERILQDPSVARQTRIDERDALIDDDGVHGDDVVADPEELCVHDGYVI